MTENSTHHTESAWVDPWPEATTVAELLIRRIQETPDKIAIRWRQKNESELQELSWEQLGDLVSLNAKLLSHFSVGHGDHVALLSENRIEWIIADLAIQHLGAINVPFHSQLTAKQVCQLVEHCRPKLVLVSTEKQARKLDGLQSRPPTLSFDGEGESSWSDLLKQTLSGDFRLKSENVANLSSTDLISILYTSGTTGEPKGVMLSHKNVMANVRSKMKTLPLGEDDLRICVLPLSHIFARVCDLYTWIISGCETVLSEGWDKLWDELTEFRPNFLNAVPYFYEKCFRIIESQNQLQNDRALSDLLGGRTKVLNCGGATLALPVYEYFLRHDVGLVAGYGLTETSPVASSNRPGHCRLGSVGPAVPGVELQIASDGEVLIRGENVMVGYYKNEAMTAEVMDGDWFRSGDIGRIDEDGYLFITGRKKEMIVTTGGKNIAPIPLENALTAHLDIEQAMIFGEQQNYLVALIVPTDLNSSPDRDFFCEAINDCLKDFSKYEQVGNFALLREPFTIENNMLTAKKSLRRTVVAEFYSELLETLYR